MIGMLGHRKDDFYGKRVRNESGNKFLVLTGRN